MGIGKHHKEKLLFLLQNKFTFNEHFGILHIIFNAKKQVHVYALSFTMQLGVMLLKPHLYENKTTCTTPAPIFLDFHLPISPVRTISFQWASSGKWKNPFSPSNFKI